MVFDGPYFVLFSVLSLMLLCFALDLICVMWFLKDSCWSKVIPRNLPDDLKGMGVLWKRIGFAVTSTVDLRECFLNINSNDLFSLILIRRFPQKEII